MWEVRGLGICALSRWGIILSSLGFARVPAPAFSLTDFPAWQLALWLFLLGALLHIHCGLRCPHPSFSFH